MVFLTVVGAWKALSGIRGVEANILVMFESHLDRHMKMQRLKIWIVQVDEVSLIWHYWYHEGSVLVQLCLTTQY